MTRDCLQPRPWKGLIQFVVILSVVIASFQPFDPSIQAKSPQISASGLATGGWIKTCVDCPKWIYNLTDRSLQVDGNGYAHIAYGGDALYYAWQDSAGWHQITVDSNPLSGLYASLALDEYNFAHISYVNKSEKTLNYAWQDSTGWHRQVIDHLEIYEIFDKDTTSIALDQQGYAHISYSEIYNSLALADQNASGWYTNTVPIDTSTTKVYSSLALDQNDWPHISFSSYDTLNYAYKDATGWHFENDLDTGDIRSTSIVLDSNGTPNIAYYWSIYVSPQPSIKYATKNAEGWQIHEVDSAYVYNHDPAINGALSIGLDQNGYAHISYYGAGDMIPSRVVKHAYQDASGWHTEMVDDEGEGRAGSNSSYYSTSLAIKDGKIYTAYLLWDNLKLAVNSGSDWQNQTVDEAAWAGNNSTLRIDQNGYAHLVQIRRVPGETTGDLQYSYQDNQGWHHQALVERWVEGLVFDLDREGYAHILYSEYHYAVYPPYRTTKYTYQDGSGWHTEDAFNVKCNPPFNSLAIDSMGNPHTSCWVNDNQGSLIFYHVYKNSSGWITEPIVTSTEYTGYGESLAIDQHGFVHISYLCPQCTGFKYAHQTASGWQIETIPDLANLHYSSVSLALDTQDLPHVVSFYQDIQASSLILRVTYSWKDSMGWHTEIINTTTNGTYPSLVLDQDGNAHVCYHQVSSDQQISSLVYSYQAPSGWLTETIDSQNTSGCSIQLNPEGNTHISYMDVNLGDLKYAAYVPTLFFTYLPVLVK